jgi:hypothetical protein
VYREDKMQRNVIAQPQVARLSDEDAARLLAELKSDWVRPPIEMEIGGKVDAGEVRQDWEGRWYIVIAVAPYYYLSEEDAESMGLPGCDGGWTPCEVREIAEPREGWEKHLTTGAEYDKA